MAGSSAERFIGWALPQLREGNGDTATIELALAGLHEFFSAGDANGIERYASPVVRACKELLEDERTSLTLLRSLLNLLTVLSAKFTRHFQSHFADIVDLLLGWALVPDLSETDRCLITDKFLQFQKLWAGNLQFSANLLSKFLGDMEVLAQDATPGTPQQLRRLLALVSCFVIVLQATATGMLEMNLLEHIIEPLQEMVPRLLSCLLVVAQNFGDPRWLKESSRCLILLADILKERFAKFYPAAVDVLLQCLGKKNTVVSGANVFSSNKVQAVVKTNLQLMSSQSLALESSAVHIVLKVDSFFAYLRLHPNHLVTGLVAATYIFLLKHGSNEVVSQAIVSITSELDLLTGLLLNAPIPGSDSQDILGVQQESNERNNDRVAAYLFRRILSEPEISALIRFDIMVLINSLMDTDKGPVDLMLAANTRLHKAEEFCNFILEKLNPFRNPFSCHADLQYALIQALHKLSNFIVCGKDKIIEAFPKTFEAFTKFKGSSQISAQKRKEITIAVSSNINVYGFCIAKALTISSGLSVKLEALDWISSFCEILTAINTEEDSFQCFSNIDNQDFQTCCHTGLSRNVLFAVLSAASDRELKVRFRVASVLESLLQAKLIYPVYLAAVADVALEKLGDPDSSIQIAFRKILSLVFISAMYLGGCVEINDDLAYQNGMPYVTIGTRKYCHWKKVFAIKHFSQSSRPQQLVSVLNYISQRWQVFPSNWLQRLVLSYCGNLKSGLPKSNKDSANSEADGLWMEHNIDGEMLERVCSTNNLAAAWWSIHEAARHCIAIRLRTHLGSPTQTFAALERMLLDVAQLLQVDPGRREASSGTGSPGVHLLPMRLLLEFVESLKKEIYNAYEGSAVLPAAPSQSVVFFRGNKKVCEEWFARICEALMNASLAIQCNPGIIHHAAIRLQDLRNASVTIARSQTVDNSQGLRTKILNDALRVLRHTSLAFCRVHESDAIVGLQTWAASTFGALTTDDSTPGQKNMGTSGLFGWLTGLVHQAKGQYEKAAAHFTHLLQSEDALGSMGADAVQFVIARIIENYVALADWDSLDHWLQELQLLRAKHAGKSYSGALTTAGNEMNAIHALARFDEGDVQGAWGYLGLTPQSSSELTVDPRQAVRRSEQMLLQAMLHRDSKEDVIKMEIERAKAMLEEALLVSSIDGMSEAAAYATQFHCIYAYEAGCKLVACQDEFGEYSTVSSSLQQVVQVPMNMIQQDCFLWSKVLRVYRTVLPESKLTLQLCRQLIRLARKQSNFKMAHRLHQQLLDGVSKCKDIKFSDWMFSSLHYERILLLFAEGNLEEAISELWALVRSYIPISPVAVVSASDNPMKAKACLKLTSWLKKTYSEIHWPDLLTKMNLDNIWYKSCEITSNMEEGTSSREANLMSVTSYALILEQVVGTSVKTATLLCPKMSKSWLSYALWCYDLAKASLSGDRPVLKSCHLSQILVQEFSCAGCSLLEEEVMSVRATIMRFFLKNETTMLLSEEMWQWPDTEVHRKTSVRNFVELLIQRIVYIMQSAAGAAGVENADGESASSLLFSQLHREMLNINQEIDSSVFVPLINDLMDIWWILRRRRVSLFGCAARGFIQFLSLSNRMHTEKSNWKRCDLELEKYGREDSTLKATLYVLNILVNFGVELEETIEQGLMTVSPVPWQDTIPQLFARLSTHPEKKVRKQLESLLMTLAKISPWAIVYPTLVDINACEGEPSEELQHILDCLGKIHPKLVQDVQLMIVELGSITVLWEEQWLSTLQDLHADVLRRIATLKEEVSRVAENMTLTHSEKVKINAAKYSAMMAPIAVALERRLASTSRLPETAHEAWFQREYGQQIKDAITSFKMPHSTAASLADVWRPFDIIAASLANHQKKPSVSLGDVAPKLAQLSSSDAPMPGLEKQILISDSEAEGSDRLCPVTVSSFSEQVTILATKTKPKKLVFLGSDGQRYTYLLKGREDLRLDARIMQLLRAINGMLNGSLDMRSRLLAVRYYSVTPISGRAGLIQWVDNVVSMYSVFKAWQQRVQYAQIGSTVGGTPAANIPPVPRPSDMFYGKIIPALKEKGLRKVISRRDWPQEVKRKVLLDLMKETPRQLLYKEIWCSSEGLQNFSLKLQRFSGTVAAMSMVGFILGLGDRHLDNILMDFSTGDVVHIDYNVCFDKGLRLKIPEIVPFRLTQTMQAALGLTGIEGTFRANCEVVIDVLRKNKDIILMLLEVFVWDPLIEWMRGDGHDEATIGGEERKGMELAVSLSLFASRFQEIRVPLQEHHDLLLGTLPASSSALQNLADMLDRYETISTVFGHAEQERSKCVMAEASAKSILIEAAGNLEKVRIAYELQAHEFSQAKVVLTETAQKASTWIEQHSKFLDALRNGSAQELQVVGKTSGAAEALSLTSAVLAAGVPLTIVPEPTQAHCQEVDKEVERLTKELYKASMQAAKALQSYSVALQCLLRGNYIASSQMHSWAQVLQLCVRQLSPEVLSLARRQAADLVGKGQGERADIICQNYETLRIKIDMLDKEIRKIQEDCSELEASIESENEHKAKDRLLAIFTKHLQPNVYSGKDDDTFSRVSGYNRQDETKDRDVGFVNDEKKFKVLTVLHVAAASLYREIKGKLFNICNSLTDTFTLGQGEDRGSENWNWCLPDLEEQIERCALVINIVTEVQQLSGQNFIQCGPVSWDAAGSGDDNWNISIQGCLTVSRSLVSQMTGLALPEAIKSVLSHDPAIMEAFGSLSQIRGAVDTALEQLAEIEIQRSSLIELEKTYYENVEEITKKKASLEMAIEEGRDHLSWEEAEELASQVEAYRAQLDKLRNAWEQREIQASTLARRELSAQGALVAAEQRFESLVTIEHDVEVHPTRGYLLLATFARPFSELQSFDQKLASFGHDFSEKSSSNQIEIVSSGFSGFESVWKAANILKDHTFFVWKVGIIDASLDSCIRNFASAIDHNTLGFDQIVGIQKRKLEMQIEYHLDQYLRERLAPIFLECLEKEEDSLRHILLESRELESNIAKKEFEAVKRAQGLLVEYSNAHETARAARAAASAMKLQVRELSQDLQKAKLEAAQLEWLHDSILPLPEKESILTQSCVNDDKLPPSFIMLNRRNLLDNIRSAMSAINRATEDLQICERSSISTEEQLERAMGWACAGPSTGSGSNNSCRGMGIPPEFHEHLCRRKHLLLAGKEQASGILKLCSAVSDFEDSRDGFVRPLSDVTPGGSLSDVKAWQQGFLNIVSRLDHSYHSFTRADHEWHLAQKSMEAATASLSTATNDLRLVSIKSKSTSGELQATLSSMREWVVKASEELSAFCRVARSNSALTTETGSMLEEVLAITEGAEGAHDVYRLAKDAAAQHSNLMSELNKVTLLLLPLESTLASASSTIISLINRDGGQKLEVLPGQGQAIFQSLHSKLGEVRPILMTAVPVLLNTVKELHIALTKLARTASFDAGVLHKALEGVGESQEARSQELDLVGPELDRDEVFNINQDRNLAQAVGDNDEHGRDSVTDEEILLQGDEESWISPPDSLELSGSESDGNSSKSTICQNQEDPVGIFNDWESHLSVADMIRFSGGELEDSSKYTVNEDILFTSPSFIVNSQEDPATVPHIGTDGKFEVPCMGNNQICTGSNRIPFSESTNHKREDSPASVKANSEILSTTQINVTEIGNNYLNATEKHRTGELQQGNRQEQIHVTTDKGRVGSYSELSTLFSSMKTEQRSHTFRGKNAYAVSVLKRVEARLEGRDTDGKRQFTVSEQVDHLLRQATSIDNLCNMYEGWTPWI